MQFKCKKEIFMLLIEKLLSIIKCQKWLAALQWKLFVNDVRRSSRAVEFGRNQIKINTIVGQAKWTPSNCAKGIQRWWCFVYNGRKSFAMSFIKIARQLIQTSFHLVCLKASIKEKHPKLFKIKDNHLGNGGHIFSDQIKTVITWLASFHSSALFTIVLLDYQLFWSLHNFLHLKIKFNNLEDYKIHTKQFIADKDKSFCGDGIMKLLVRWLQKIE